MDNKELIFLTRQITNELNRPGNKQWTFTSNGDDWGGQSIVAVTGNAKLYISKDAYAKEDRVNISGSLHIGENGQYVTVYAKGTDGTGWFRQFAPDISVAVKRGPQVIATEIQRRLLPEYLRVLALAEDIVAKDKAYKASKQSNLVRLANAANVPIKKLRVEDNHASFYLAVGTVDGTVRASASDADIDLRNLSVEQAEKVINFLHTL